MKHLNHCISQAMFLKQLIKDKKNDLLKLQGNPIKPSNQPVGLKCLGAHYMMAHDFYKSMGDFFFDLASKKGQLGILPLVKKCYFFAAQNLKNIIDAIPSDSDKIPELKGKLNKTLEFAEMINQKIVSDPLKYDQQQIYFSQFNEQEQSIINGAALMRDIQYSLWSPALGITNIYSNKQYLDPNGMLPLSLKQM